MIRKFGNLEFSPLPIFRTPIPHCLCSISTWSSNMYPKHNTSKYKFDHPQACFSFLISINISNFLPVTSTKTLKDLERGYPKIFFVLYFPIDSGIKIKPGQIFLPLPLTATIMIHDTINTIFSMHYWMYLWNTLLYYLLIFHPHLLNVVYFFKCAKLINFSKNLQDSYHWGKFKDVNRSYRSLQKCFHFLLCL